MGAEEEGCYAIGVFHVLRCNLWVRERGAANAEREAIPISALEFSRIDGRGEEYEAGEAALVQIDSSSLNL